jgi:hypothetical protein
MLDLGAATPPPPKFEIPYGWVADLVFNTPKLAATKASLTLSLLMSYVYGAPCKARNFNVVYIWTYV